jgi:hypothetical protein
MGLKPVRWGPAYISGSYANILNPGTITGNTPSMSGNLFFQVMHIRVTNNDSSNHNFSMYLGGTGAHAVGTEVVGIGQVVFANASYDYYGMLILDVADYLVGIADTASKLTFTAEGFLGIR